MCLLTIRGYYKEKQSDEVSEKMLVNLEEFNDRLLAHGSDSKLQMSITGYYIAQIKTQAKDTGLTKGPKTNNYGETHRSTKTHANTNVFKMCVTVLVDWST